MTFIWTLASAHGVVQVSDRRVSADGRTISDQFNKTVIVKARNAMLTLSFTGLAKAGPLPFDSWITHNIAGLPTNSLNGELSGLLVQRLPQWRDAGQIANILRSSLEDLKPLKDKRYNNYFQTILLSGWQWKQNSGRVRLIGRTIEKQLNSNQAVIRDWIARQHDRTSFVLAAAPMPPPFSRAEIEDLQARLRPVLHDLDTSADILAQSIRLASSRLPTVGRDCCAVMLPPPQGIARAECRYLPEYTPKREWLVFDYPAVLIDDVILSKPSRVFLTADAVRDKEKAGGASLVLGDCVTLRI